MVASPNSVRFIGAVPILVDVEEETLGIDIDKVEELFKIDNLIKGVMHVSLNARCNDIERLLKICKKYNKFCFEDSAQSLGSFYQSKHLGTFGEIGSFSFSSPKIITTGQGGALVTNSETLSKIIYDLKNFGRSRGGNDTHDFFGINSKFTDLQAAFGIEQMKKMPIRAKRMREIWDIYYAKLNKSKDMYMFKATEGWIPWFIDIYVDNPKELASYLKTKNIGTRLVYPPIHSQLVYSYYSHLSFPVTEYYSTRGLWLPSSTTLTNSEINKICDIILDYYL